MKSNSGRRGGAPLTPLRDESELDDSTINVGVRIAWLLRAARQGSEGNPSQSAFRSRLAGLGMPVSAAKLSRAESGLARSSRLIHGYEAVLGLSPAELLAPVDVLCRTFPNSPRDLDPELEPVDLETLSALASVIDSGKCTGADWLAWASAVTRSQAVGIPLWIFEPWVRRLISELERSVGRAYATRYEALGILRCGPYAEVVLRLGREFVEDPHAQALYDVVSAMTELPDPTVLAWCCSLLDDPRTHAAHAGMLGLANLTCLDQLSRTQWSAAVEPLMRSYQRSVTDPERHKVVSHALTILPLFLRRQISAKLDVPLVRPDRLRRYGRQDQSNPDWTSMMRLATIICADHSLSDVEMLARLLFEALIDHRDERAITSWMLLQAVPFREQLVHRVFEYVFALAPGQRILCLDRLAAIRSGVSCEPPEDWQSKFNTAERLKTALLLAQGGQPVPRPVLDSLLAVGGPHLRHTLMTAAHADPQWLAAVADNPEHRPEVRGAARWWLDQGGSVRA